MKFLKKFSTTQDYDEAKQSLILPNLSLIKDANDVAFNPIPVQVTGLTINKSTLNLDIDSSKTLVANVLPPRATNKAVAWETSDSNIATVNGDGIVGVVSAISAGTTDIIVRSQEDSSISAVCTTTVITPAPSHDYVEIGGLKWATMNIGAESVTDAGLYFQWGDTQGYTAAQVGSGSGQKAFTWNNYKYWTADTGSGSSGVTKYNSTDGKTVLEASDDAAQAAWGGNWRMPTTAEFAALGAATTRAWTTDYEGSGVAGLVLTSKADSNVKLFFPAAGYGDNGSMSGVGSYGIYWSSSRVTSNELNAYDLYFYSSDVYWQSIDYRRYGFSVRPVFA